MLTLPEVHSSHLNTPLAGGCFRPRQLTWNELQQGPSQFSSSPWVSSHRLQMFSFFTPGLACSLYTSGSKIRPSSSSTPFNLARGCLGTPFSSYNKVNKGIVQEQVHAWLKRGADIQQNFLHRTSKEKTL